MWSPNDILFLSAGNARALDGGDPDALPASPDSGRIAGSAPPVIFRQPITDADLVGDLDASARRLGVDVADLVALRQNRRQDRP